MAAESPIRIIEASGKWSLNGQRFQGRNGNLYPNRSGSAPPSIEGSFAAIENIIFRKKFTSGIPESEEQLRADPSYFEYYSAHVNLNPRLPPPLISDENRNIFWSVRGNGNNRRSAHSTREEKSDEYDDGSAKQEDLPQAHSPAYNQSRPFKHEPNDDTNPTTTTVSIPSSIEGKRGNMVILPPVNESVNSDVSDIRNGILTLNISNFPKLETERNPNKFLQNPMNLQSSGFTPPHYGTDLTYMMSSGTHMYPNIMPARYFQYPPPVSPYATGYLPHTPFPTPFSNASPSFSGQSQSQTFGVNLQHFNNFYGHLGQPFRSQSQSQTLGVNLQHLNNFYGHIGQLFSGQRQSQTFGVNLQHLNNLYGYLGQLFSVEEHNLQSLRGVGHVNLQFPTLPFVSPVIPGRRIGEWKGYTGNNVINDTKTYSFLEDLKSGKGRRLEISDIYGHIVEFSVDQHGSRFIQQKLEICSNDEKENVFKEVILHASRLITDVFGNYVIQKFFEYGNVEQRRELGNQLEGQMLTLSLQMYGCRVIQKALDAIDLEQKTKLICELDGHILKCVRDQNGNHVIQKCIESIPTENIKFMMSSFCGHVAALSKHPYGCRVIQRVLEHSTDELHSQFIVDEILDSVYDLAQDQYGNYVTQYVLEGGKPEEKSQIVHKLTGQIVKLSQHKFASNVIEKCLEYGDSAAREFMINEIIGYDDGNDNLLVMVKDQFANYVVQKVLQTCSGHQRDILLGRIKINLNSLKKYTYGKHIVALFEQLYVEEIEAES